jgi:hypothetical protein
MRYWKFLDGAAGCPGPSRVGEGGGLDKQVVKSCLPMPTIMSQRDDADCSQVQFLLGWWPLIFNQEWWVISVMGCMIPQSFVAGGNRSYPEFWVVTDGSRYLEY